MASAVLPPSSPFPLRRFLFQKMLLDENASKGTRHKRKLKCKGSKYLKPGLLAQYRSRKAMISTKLYTELESKRTAVLNDGMINYATKNSFIVKSPAMANSPIAEKLDANQSNVFMKTPTAPVVNYEPSESMLESLPMDILVKIVCHLHHDELKPAFHVSRRLRKAAVLARQIHFNYTTPVRSRQGLMRVHTPVPTEHWLFGSKASLDFGWTSSPRAPKAPIPGPRPPSHLKYTDIRQIAAVLFPETSFSSRYMVPSVLQRTPCKPMASHRVLFYEEELCQAVSQNRLL